MRIRLKLAALALFLLARPGAHAADAPPTLWQEHYFWDALTSARDRMSRQQSDPQMLPVMKAIAGQIAQQAANLDQIDQYVKAQAENLSYAYAQSDPDPSLATIEDNLETLSEGSNQVRQNLYYLTSRARMAATQALPDPEMYKAGLLILGQVQQLQLILNATYVDSLAARRIVLDNKWANDPFFMHKSEEFMRSVVRMQDSLFAVYNASYDLTMRCR